MLTSLDACAPHSTNRYTGREEEFDPNQIFTSPSSREQRTRSRRLSDEGRSLLFGPEQPGGAERSRSDCYEEVESSRRRDRSRDRDTKQGGGGGPAAFGRPGMRRGGSLPL